MIKSQMQPDQSPYIEIIDLVKVYRTGVIEIQALRSLCLTVNQGEFIAIMGPSGSGKTTLLNILGGLDYPTAGNARVGNQSLTQFNRKERMEYRRNQVGHVFQTLNLMPTLTAKENIELPMVAAHLDQATRFSRIQKLANILGISDRLSHIPDELSGGEKQRVAIATALANDPPLIIADEPTGELDTENAQNIMHYFQRINQELGKTIIYVTHDPVTARAAQRILRIVDGRIIGAYTPAQLNNSPQPTSITDHLKQRIQDITEQIHLLDQQMYNQLLSPETYTKKRQELVFTIKLLNDELHRYGD